MGRMDRGMDGGTDGGCFISPADDFTFIVDASSTDGFGEVLKEGPRRARQIAKVARLAMQRGARSHRHHRRVVHGGVRHTHQRGVVGLTCKGVREERERGEGRRGEKGGRERERHYCTLFQRKTGFQNENAEKIRARLRKNSISNLMN